MPTLSLEKLPAQWLVRLSENSTGWTAPDYAASLSWGMAQLRPAQACLLEAFHMDGKSVREIAEEMGVSERAVEGRLRRARLKLRKQLEPVVRRPDDEGELQ
jgi:DNA-directed RNA polymerase specialized sigma24 family protein